MKEMLTALPRKLCGNAIVMATALRRRGIEYRNPEALCRLRDRRIRQLVRYAAGTVPYYRDWFRDQNVDPRDIRTAEDLEGLPILEKSTVRQDPERFRSASRRGRRAIRFNTSGSTGTPLVFYHDLRSILANMAHGEPAHAAESEIVGRRFGFRSLGISRSGSTYRKVSDICARNTLIPKRRRSNHLDVADPVETVVETMRRLKPDVLGSYGSYLEMFFRYVHERGIDLPLPRLAHFSADGMTEPGYRLITGQFGIPVLASYAAVEVFKIGFMCGHGFHYHLQEDLCHVRIVDQHDQTLPPGETGSVIINNLVNRGTVLLNYRIGDIAALGDRNCPCGRTFRLLTNLQGRDEDMLMLANGRFLHPRAIWAVLRTAEGLLRYQVIQHEPARFELKLVTTGETAYREIVRQALPELRGILGDSVQIDVDRYDELQPDASGKFRPVVSKCKK